MALILFEDDHLLVVNKPAGWNTHAPSPFAGEGIFDWLRSREPRWARLAIIHRLDKETSGVLAFGKTPEANRSLTHQFASHVARKKYLLLTDRPIKRDQFTVVSSIVRAGEKYISRPAHTGTAHAQTRFAIIQRGEILTQVQAEPVTGRTHQIRVHAAEQGFPILGDTGYGGTKAERLFLHAAELSLQHPVTEGPLTFCAPVDWKAVTGPPFREITGAQCRNKALRAGIIDPQLTNAFRLIHGASDDWSDFYVEKTGEFLFTQSKGALTEAQHQLLRELARTHGARGVYHKQLRKNVRGTSEMEASPQFLFGQVAPERFRIRENGLTFELSFNEGYSVGLFFDQRDNRRRLLVNHVAADFPLLPNGAAKAQVLNMFAYTCGFSVAAAKAGAITTSIDLSKKYLEWGKRNFISNNLDPGQHDFIYGDAFDWMRRLAKKGRTFDCVILDPPTFSQSKDSGAWQAEKHYGKLVETALPLIKPGGILFASTNAARLEPQRFLDAISEATGKRHRKVLQQHYVPQPPDFPISREEPAYLKTVWLRLA